MNQPTLPQPPTLTAQNLATIQKSVGAASQLLKAMSHPDRLLLLYQLSQGEFCVSDLEQKIGLGQPNLSQQLGILRKAELVITRRVGKQIYYSIINEDVLAVLGLLHYRFCQTASSQLNS